MPPSDLLLAPRWRGRPGRLEVWYATLTDPATGEGFWIHHEVVAPADGGEARRHGWAVAFPPGGPPVVGRYTGEAEVQGGVLRGRAGALAWDLELADDGAPLFTFPRAAWRRELLPAAQIVPLPSARVTGTIAVGERVVELRDAPGNLARIYGQGNAERWGWLHADLGHGDVLEAVAAVSRRPGLRRLPPLGFVQLRERGMDWPRNPLLAAPRMRAELRADGFALHGACQGCRIRADVRLDPAESVTLDYDEPEGTGPRCTNSARASLDLVVERRNHGGRWSIELERTLDHAAHAEVGSR